MPTVIYGGPYLRNKNIEIEQIHTSGHKKVRKKIKNPTFSPLVFLPS